MAAAVAGVRQSRGQHTPTENLPGRAHEQNGQHADGDKRYGEGRGGLRGGARFHSVVREGFLEEVTLRDAGWWMSEPVELLDQVLWVGREQRPRRSGGPCLRQAVRHPSYVPPGLQLPLAVQFQCPSVLQLNASERNHWRTGPERPLPAPFQAGERCCVQTAVLLGRGGASRSLPLSSTVRCPSESCHLQRSRDVTTSLHPLATAPAHALLATAW